MKRTKAIIDCDPGHDDAVAILLAARHFDLLGVTTVGGNAPVWRVTENALRVLELIGRPEVPVARGAAGPILGSLPRAGERVHGATGLDGAELPRGSNRVITKGAVEFLVETVMGNPGTVVIATGPLTNLALAMRVEPRLAKSIARLSIMGGSATWGNVTAAAEFNAWADPEAAHIVFSSGARITMCGLDLTRQAAVGPETIARFRAVGTHTAEVVADLLEHYRAAAERVYGTPAVPLHDPCAVAALAAPELFEVTPAHVAVELRGEETRGMTVVDRRFLGAEAAEQRRAAGAPEPNCRLATRVDAEGLFRLVEETLAACP
ncbi:nucleoside hydrolase [Tepidiforma bonchosmolovskayae]|uniref:Nucleoside hydrolase n=1 Tax=Tepidiforma bonchosmolovskayae TaxID=2601677 RepID=A0ABX6C4V4_9CHLR|nr:nucleoside hydrolase [Tepidiforma bonchosmolovskayae]QFG03723.1 nucleoside hydrolase [Tepidiforma bonchosmolovskayae]